jgi:hypothetical protein
VISSEAMRGRHGVASPNATHPNQYATKLSASRLGNGDSLVGTVVDRIEALGGNAVAVGSDGRDLHFTSVRRGRYPELVDRYTRKDAAQGETHSRGFFYKPTDQEEGAVTEKRIVETRRIGFAPRPVEIAR